MNNCCRLQRFGLACLLGLLGMVLVMRVAHAQSPTPELNAALNESVIEIDKKALIGSVALETTLYKPDGPGPFPIVLISHGKAPGDARFQSRYRPAVAVRYFLQRGYAVVVPMRQGFSKSGGRYIGGGCNIESNGLVQAEDVKAALDYTVQQPWADKSRILLVGQSHGGWTTLATGTLNYPGVMGLVNFAGGLRQEDCAGWEAGLARAAGAYAPKTQVPSLWFYGDNDSYFSRPTWEAMFQQYTQAGGKARLVAFGTFASDSHRLFGASAGARIWQPEVTRFLEQIGLPSQPVLSLARFAPGAAMALPPKTDFAPLSAPPPLPFLSAAAQAGYQTFLTKDFPRAFAVAPTGAWSWSDDGDDPARRALDRCNTRAAGQCRLYAVDQDVVWTSP